jgi:hypothetical protein
VNPPKYRAQASLDSFLKKFREILLLRPCLFEPKPICRLRH